MYKNDVIYGNNKNDMGMYKNEKKTYMGMCKYDVIYENVYIFLHNLVTTRNRNTLGLT